MAKETKEQESKEKEEDTSTSESSTEEQNDETSEGEADTSENTDTDDSENEESEDTDEGVDFKAELKKAKKKVAKAENAAIKYKKRWQDAKSGTDSEDEQEEEQETKQQPTQIIDVEKVAKRTAEIVREDAKREMVSDEIEDQLSQIKNDDERELTRFHYENTIKPTGFTRTSIAEDIRKAHLLANEKRITNTMSELSESLKSKSGISKAGMGSSTKKPQPKGEKLTGADAEFLKRRGENPDNYRFIDGEVVKVT